MLRTLIGASLLGALLSGCAGLASSPHASCGALFEQLQAATHTYQDVQHQRLAGFPGLRSDRTLALLGHSARNAEQRQLWLQRLAEHDNQASLIEIAQLPPAPRRFWSSTSRQTALGACRTAQIAALNSDPAAFAQAVAAAQIADDYRGWARALGLYPLFEPFYRRGIAAWQQAAAQARAPEDGPQWLGYRPIQLSAQAPMPPQRLDALGLPQVTAERLDALFARHAPWLKIAQASRHDRIGSPHYRNDGSRDLHNLQPRLYQHLGWSQLGGRWHLQLIYQFWFGQRPKQHALDLFGGELDGLLWRVTLDAQGNALLYDSIHPCGCWHSFYLPQDSTLQLQQADNEEARQAQPLEFKGDQAATLWLSAGEHQLQWVDARRSAYPAIAYQSAELDQLRQLPHPQGRRSLYGADGLIPGSQRLERWLLWPSGVKSAGAMRQWGRHATAFIGRAHFDDPHLLERYFPQP
ncbi:MAG TPA: hypothetical protein VFY62_18920 [Pseudomonas sp.]|nr:hypothetical protein [Pseudomonas sp.]